MKMRIKFLIPMVGIGTCVIAGAQELKTDSVSPPKTTSPAVNTNEYKPSSDPAEAAACTKNLQKIATAIAAYRKDNHDVPIGSLTWSRNIWRIKISSSVLSRP